MEDEKIIELFFARSEQGIQELDIKYGKICHRLSYNIVNNRQDEEECVNDAYLGAWNAIPPATPNPIITVTSVAEMETYLDFHVPVLDKEVKSYSVIVADNYPTTGQVSYEDGSKFRIQYGSGDISGIYGGH